MAKRKTTSAKRPSVATKTKSPASAAKPPTTKGPAKAKSRPAKKSSSKVAYKKVPLDAMQDATFYHVIKRDNQWAVKREGATRASGIYETKDAAEKAARDFKAFNKHIIVHKRDGSIEKWITSRAA